MNEERKGFWRDTLYSFDRMEDKLRRHLASHPVIYALIGGVATVLFWRGVWHTADALAERDGWIGWLFYEPVSLVLSLIVLLVTGLFVSFFINDVMLMTGLKQEKRIATETKKEVEAEGTEVATLQSAIQDLKDEVDGIKDIVQHEHDLHHPDRRES